jgi:hypothetical protein
MTPDPKWLEILKASGWQTTALAVAFGLFLLAGRAGWLPPLDPWMIQLAALGLLVCGCLSLASIASATLEFFPLQIWLKYWIDSYRNKRQVIQYIPHMTSKEREIIAHLIHNNQTTFTAAIDGGHAKTLLARGIVNVIAAPGQYVDQENVPMTIRPSVWKALVKHKAKFPYKPPEDEDDEDPEGPPWRVHWMEQ